MKEVKYIALLDYPWGCCLTKFLLHIYYVGPTVVADLVTTASCYYDVVDVVNALKRDVAKLTAQIEKQDQWNQQQDERNQKQEEQIRKQSDKFKAVSSSLLSLVTLMNT